MSVPRVTTALLQPQMNMLTPQANIGRVILQQQGTVGLAGGGKSVIQTVNGHTGNQINGTTTNNGTPESTLLKKNQKAVLSSNGSNGMSTGPATTVHAPATYLTQARISFVIILLSFF